MAGGSEDDTRGQSEAQRAAAFDTSKRGCVRGCGAILGIGLLIALVVYLALAIYLAVVYHRHPY